MKLASEALEKIICKHLEIPYSFPWSLGFAEGEQTIYDGVLKQPQGL